MKEYIIGIDLGGTNLRIGTVTADYSVQNQKIMNSNLIANAANPLEEFCCIIKEYIDEFQVENIKAISIGVPSSVASDNETVVCTTNIRNDKDEAVFQNINLANPFRERFAVPVFVNNDTNNILLYDVYSHKLMKQPVVVGVYIGTGVGSAVLIDGKTMSGANGAALDIGHLPFYKSTDLCSCGKEGCCECYASGWKLQQIREAYFPEVDIADLFTVAGESWQMQDFIYSCAHICAIMTTIFNPNSLVIGGGVPEMRDFPRERFEQLVNENTGRDVMSFGFDYVYSADFPGKGMIGAAIFAGSMMEKD